MAVNEMEKSCKKCSFLSSSDNVCDERMKRGFPRDMCDIPVEVLQNGKIWGKCPLENVDSKIEIVTKSFHKTKDGMEFESLEEALNHNLSIEIKGLFGISDGETEDMVILKEDLLELLLSHR